MPLRSPLGKPKLSKNTPTYLTIGTGLSTLVGLSRVATWNTAGRPPKPKPGTIGFNTDAQKLEIWTGDIWYAIASKTAGMFKGGLQALLKKTIRFQNSPTHLSIGNGLSILVGFPRIATWDTLGRPSKPKKGTIGFNVQTQSLEIWTGTIWYLVPMKLMQ